MLLIVCYNDAQMSLTFFFFFNRASVFKAVSLIQLKGCTETGIIQLVCLKQNKSFVFVYAV